MSRIHFLNVLEGDCNIIEHDSGNISVIDVSNADNKIDTEEEKRKKASNERKEIKTRNYVPSGKVNYNQKSIPDNPIDYLNGLGVSSIFRFIITHPDCDHIDGIKDLYDEFSIANTWDTDNDKKIDTAFGAYSKDDWEFYTKIRDGSANINRRTYYSGVEVSYYTEDNIKVLCPTPELVKQANKSSKDYHDLSYVLLYTPPKKGGKVWKIIFAGDSFDASWDYIMENYPQTVSNIDVLIAPHHGRGSGRNFEFLKTLKPNLTLFGNASSEHLAYDNYPKIRITNNQAGYIILDISEDKLVVYCKHFDFVRDFKSKRGWAPPSYDSDMKAYGLIQFSA